MSDDLDELLRVADPVPPGDDVLGQRVALVAAQARATAERERRRAARRRVVVTATATGALLSVGAVTAAAGGGVLSWEWFDRPDARSVVTMSSGEVCEVRLAAFPEDGPVRYDDDPVVAAAAASMRRIDMASLDVSRAMEQFDGFDVLPPGVPRPDPTYPPGTNPRALGSSGPQLLTADEAYTYALLDTVRTRVEADLRTQGITAPYSTEAFVDCTGEGS